MWLSVCVDALQDLFGNDSYSDLMMKIEFYSFPVEAVLETGQSFSDVPLLISNDYSPLESAPVVLKQGFFS